MIDHLGHWNVHMFEFRQRGFGKLKPQSLPEGWEPIGVLRDGNRLLVAAREFIPVPDDSEGDRVAREIGG